MKNIFKYLSVFAIAGALGLQTLNVSAENTCAEDETVHTNYYLFLDVNTAEFYEQGINGTPEGTSFTLWNGAYKYNNIQKATIIEDGAVGITKGSETTSADAAITWTAEEYWKKYYTASKNVDANLMYTSGDESYFLHDKWWSYDENYENGVEKSSTNTAIADALFSYILGNWSNLATSDLVTKGTSLPVSKIDVPSNITTSTSATLMWHISRVFGTKDILTGVTLNNGKYVYSPAAHYVKFCVKSETPAPTEKTVTYDANTTDVVSGLPSKDTFTTECTTISSSVPVRSGYSFLGWSTNASSTTADSTYAAGAQYCGDSITLYAIWAKNQTGPFTVTYDANGGKNAPATQSGEAGACVTISSVKPTLSGNNFLGWSTDKNAKEPDSRFAAGQSYCGEQGDITLYAVWQTQTGVSAHFLVFGSIALIAGAALVVAKKKDLFRQI